MNEDVMILPPPKQDGQKASMDVQMEALLELGKHFLGNQQKLQMEQVALERERLSVGKWAFRHRFWLITAVVLGVFTLSGGLIFAKDNVDAGLAVMSHVAAMFAGIIGGIGFEKIRKG